MPETQEKKRAWVSYIFPANMIFYLETYCDTFHVHFLSGQSASCHAFELFIFWKSLAYFHFANYRVSFRFISFHFVSFRFVSLRFSNYGKPCEDFENTSGSSSSEDSYGENEPDLTLDCSVIKATIGTVTSAACGNKALSIIDHTSQKKPRFNKIKEQFEREPLSCDLEKRSSFCCSHFC